MAANTTFDTLLGSIPVLGDVFDVAYKSNLKNVALLRRSTSKAAPTLYRTTARITQGAFDLSRKNEFELTGLWTVLWTVSEKSEIKLRLQSYLADRKSAAFVLEHCCLEALSGDGHEMYGAKLLYFGFALDAPDLGERQSYDRTELRVLRAVEVAFDIAKCLANAIEID